MQVSVTLMLCVLLSACSDARSGASSAPTPTTDVVALSSRGPDTEIDDLKATLNTLRNVLRRHDEELEELKRKWFHQELEKISKDRMTAEINVFGNGYNIVETDKGVFFVSCDGAEPYLSGHKLKLEIGNPTSATFNGFTLTCVYGRSFKTSSTSEEISSALASRQTNQQTFVESLLPGSWTPVEVTLPGAKPEELGFITVKLAANTVLLRTSKRP